MFRIRVQGNRLAGEFSHALTDGAGAMSFMKSLLVQYFSLLGIKAGSELGQAENADILSTDSPVPPEEYEDAYQRYFPGSLPAPEANPKAWHLKGEQLPRGSYRIIVGRLKLSEVLSEVKKRNVTLSGFLGAVYLDALQSLWFAQSKKPRERIISVEIPVNLRQFFTSKTNRIFLFSFF
jgi:Alcohol acetyltransferase.